MEHVSVYVDEPVARRSAGRRRAAVYLGLAVMLAAASLVAANAAGSSTRSLSTRGAGKAGSVVPQSGGCLATFTNPGPPAMTVCASGHGNINQLEYNPFGPPVGHISTEGYCLVDLNAPSTVYWDAGTQGEANWGVATQSSTATTTTVTRTTIDGRYTLTQNIFFKYGSRLVLIGNLVKNNDTVSHHVRFNRYADIDMEVTTGGDVVDTAGASVFAKQTNGLALTSLGNPALVQAFGPEPFSTWSGTGKAACGHKLQPTPTSPGDSWRSCSTTRRSLPGATVNFRVGYRLL